MAKTVEELYDIPALRNEVLKDILGFDPEDISPEGWWEGEGWAEIMVDTISSGHQGIYQGAQAVDFFDIADELNEEDWEEGVVGQVLDPEAFDYTVEPHAREIAYKILKGTELPGVFSFQWHPDYGDYGLFYSVSESDVRELVEAGKAAGVSIDEGWLE